MNFRHLSALKQSDAPSSLVYVFCRHRKMHLRAICAPGFSSEWISQIDYTVVHHLDTTVALEDDAMEPLTLPPPLLLLSLPE